MNRLPSSFFSHLSSILFPYTFRALVFQVPNFGSAKQKNSGRQVLSLIINHINFVFCYFPKIDQLLRFSIISYSSPSRFFLFFSFFLSFFSCLFHYFELFKTFSPSQLGISLWLTVSFIIYILLLCCVTSSLQISSMSTIFVPFILLIVCSPVLSTEWTSNLNCSNTNDRLIKYQKSLSSKCELYLIPAQDSHQNTDLFEKDSNLRLISGFTGHQGLAIVFKNRSILWTTFKYELQAKRQLLCGWEVNVASDIYVHMSNWIIQNYGESCRIKVSAWQLPHQKVITVFT